MSGHMDYQKLVDGVAEAWWEWAKGVSGKLRPLYDELEATGFFDELYEEELNDPYWAGEEEDVFI